MCYDALINENERKMMKDCIDDLKDILEEFADSLAQDGLLFTSSKLLVSVDDVENLSCIKYGLCFLAGLFVWIFIYALFLGCLALGAIALGLLLWHCWWIFPIPAALALLGCLMQKHRASSKKKREEIEKEERDSKQKDDEEDGKDI